MQTEVKYVVGLGELSFIPLDKIFPFSVPLGSIPEVAAETCHEIKRSEGREAVSGKYWFDSIVPDNVVLAKCDMETEGDALLTMPNSSYYTSFAVGGAVA